MFFTMHGEECCEVKIFIMTDMEGVCGVINHDDWVTPQGRYYEEGKKLLTLEVNAAVEGFFEAGASEIFVCDAHGFGGINQAYLDPRTYLIRGMSGMMPDVIDKSFDAIAFVGQHAKAGTEYAHIAHTGWFNVLDCRINNISVGEFGIIVLGGAALGVRTIFGSGDRAFTHEARNLVKGIEAVEVKWGLIPGCGDDYDCEGYRNRNLSAIHMHPDRVRKLIKEGAKKALERFKKEKESFQLVELKSPFKKEIDYRPNNGTPAYRAYAEHEYDLIKAINADETRVK
jgi:D-amino peptidase